MTCETTKYDKRITIERLAGTADAAGHIDPTTDANWTSYAASFASVQTKGGREFWKVQQTDATVDHVWLCPWSRTLAATTPDMRLICEDVTYEILSVIDINLAHMEIEIQTRKAVR